MLVRVNRFYGYRKLLFAMLTPPVFLLMFWIIGLFASSDALGGSSVNTAVVDSFTAGACQLLLCGWLCYLMRPLKGGSSVSLWVCRVGMSAAALIVGLPALQVMGEAVISGDDGGADFALVFDHLTTTVLIPLSIALLVLVWPDISERLRTQPLLRRFLISVQGHAAGWAAAYMVAKLTRSLPENPPSPDGHLTNGIYLGQTMCESSFTRGKNVYLNESLHMITLAMTGAGKLISSIAPTLSQYRGSAVIISPKPEIADQFCGRRVDPMLFKSRSDQFDNLGIDPRKVSKASFHIPGSRTFILDPSGQGVYPSSHHNILSEVDPLSPEARSLILTIATGIVPDNPHANDPFWVNACRGFLSAGIAHALTISDDPRKHTLPYVVDMLAGIDEENNRADPAVFQQTLIDMMQNPAMGGFIQAGASSILQLGDRAFGSVNAEMNNVTRFITEPMMREHLSHESDFSYRELGDDNWPVTVHLVAPRLAMQEALPFLRVHAELSLQLLVAKQNRPATPTLFLCDEFRQYGEKIRAIRDGATILRDARVKLWLFSQSWPSLVDTIGKDGANELSSCSAKQYFGINDLSTAERISRELGQHTVRKRARKDQPGSEQVYDLVTPVEVMQELRKNSSLQYVFPATGAPMRLKRVAHKPIRTNEGASFTGLPLDGHFDDGLSRFTWGESDK